jgi:hypothetical protein
MKLLLTPLTLIFTLCLTLQASQITTYADAFVWGTMCSDAITCTEFRAGNDLNGRSSATVTINDVYGGVRGAASAAYGSIVANAYANTGTNCWPSQSFPCTSTTFPQYEIRSAGADATASFSDNIYLFGSGTANFTATVSGGAAELDSGIADARITVFTGGCYFDRTNGCRTISGQIPLNGVFSLSAFARASAVDFAPNDPGQGANGVTAWAGIGSIVLTDAQGNRITGVPYWSDSGTAYLQDEVLVPEPKSGFLLIGGLLLVFARRSRKA